MASGVVPFVERRLHVSAIAVISCSFLLLYDSMLSLITLKHVQVLVDSFFSRSRYLWVLYVQSMPSRHDGRGWVMKGLPQRRLAFC
jgi:hypothetical protein